MNEEIKQEWITALTSGEYQQGKHELRTSDNKYCCLGVLCDIAAKHGVGEWRSNRRFVPTQKQLDSGSVLAYDTSSGQLPKFVSDWAELSSADPQVDYTYSNGAVGGRALSAINDRTDEGFAGIARYIQEQL